MPLTRYRIRTPRLSLHPGERLVRGRGGSLEFLELRPYVPGDDLRWVDWKAYARTGRLYSRVFQAEAKSRFYLWLDGSPSMSLHHKDAYARRVAEVLLRVARPEGAFVLTPRGARRWRGALEADPRGPMAALPELVPRVRGTLLIVTDGLDEGDWKGLYRRLARVQPITIQVLAPEELDPPRMEAELVDVETGARVLVTPQVREQYREALAQHLRELRFWARRAGGYAHLRVGEAIVPGLVRQKVLEER